MVSPPIRFLIAWRSNRRKSAGALAMKPKPYAGSVANRSGDTAHHFSFPYVAGLSLHPGISRRTPSILQWPQDDPVNAPTRAIFRLGEFQPKDHGGHHVEPTPPTPPAPQSK
jgi:hypothetical protein